MESNAFNRDALGHAAENPLHSMTLHGIDIANTFSRFYGISAPMVLDECESVNDPIYSGDQQQIRLKVTTDDKLKFEYPSLAVME